MEIKYSEDCIHLHACRRLTKLFKINNRGCNENCSAYVSGNWGAYVDEDTAVSYAREGVESIRGGYDPYDVYCVGDLGTKTVGEIIRELED